MNMVMCSRRGEIRSFVWIEGWIDGWIEGWMWGVLHSCLVVSGERTRAIFWSIPGKCIKAAVTQWKRSRMPSVPLNFWLSNVSRTFTTLSSWNSIVTLVIVYSEDYIYMHVSTHWVIECRCRVIVFLAFTYDTEHEHIDAYTVSISSVMASPGLCLLGIILAVVAFLLRFVWPERSPPFFRLHLSRRPRF